MRLLTGTRRQGEGLMTLGIRKAVATAQQHKLVFLKKSILLLSPFYLWILCPRPSESLVPYWVLAFALYSFTLFIVFLCARPLTRQVSSHHKLIGSIDIRIKSIDSPNWITGKVVRTGSLENRKLDPSYKALNGGSTVTWCGATARRFIVSCICDIPPESSNLLH